MRHHRQSAEERKAAVIEAYKRGDSIKNICLKYRVSKNTPRKWAKEAGITPRAKGIVYHPREKKRKALSREETLDILLSWKRSKELDEWVSSISS